MRERTPYREGKTLTGIIAPDRRKQHALMLLGGGMVAGAVLLHVGGRLFDAPPPPSATPTPSAPAIDPAEVERFVRDHAADLRRACWASDRPAGSEYQALSVTLTIAPSGAVENVVPESAQTTALLELQGCVEREVRGWRFRPTEKGAVVRIPLRFESR